ncbi:unnamed protein product, partial [Sphacelaria rigidula]
QDYEPTCGNGSLEPGEDCDDDSPCCNPDTCELVPNARCSQGPEWAQWSSGSRTAAENWQAQCCTSDCQFVSSSTLCKVPGGSSNGVCSNGGCRRGHM